MCGISGWIDWLNSINKNGNQDKLLLKKLTDSIAHRGPDAEGYWMSDKAAIGHRRLIVIDPEGGKQPMVFQSDIDKSKDPKNIVLTFNGEIYNFKELTIELKKLGHSFNSRSDTEVLLHSYLEWGEDCVLHLNGIFAFAIWDEESDKLFMARDHLGVKPLFYSTIDNKVIFGSEIKVLLSHPLIPAEIGEEGLLNLFGFGAQRIPGRQIFKNVNELKAGHSIRFDNANREGVITQYWNLVPKKHEDSPKETSEKIRSMLNEIVQRQMISDMPLVSMLSGGLDSSALSSLAQQNLFLIEKKLKTFCVTFKGHDIDFLKSGFHIDVDTHYARKVADFINSDHNEIEVSTQDLLDFFDEPMKGLDLPSMGEMNTSILLLFKEMKKNATVSLSGESADEIFSGYHMFKDPEALKLQGFPWAPYWTKLLDEFISKDLREKLPFKDHINKVFKEALSGIELLDSDTEEQSKQRQISYLFIFYFLPFMLERKDRNSMMNGFEVRVPFCDYKLVEYVYNIPHSLKTIDNIEKGILRRSVEHDLPQEVLQRKKSAYPSTNNEIYVTAVRQMMKNILNNPSSPILPLINCEFLLDLSNKPNLEFHEKNVLQYFISCNSWLIEYNVKITI